MKIEDIKRVFRGIRSTKKEMELRLAFLNDVREMDFDTTDIEASILREYNALCETVALADRMLASLDPDERAVLTARYYAGVRWEYIDTQTMYSQSQNQRIHNRALKKLTAFSDTETGSKPVSIRARKQAHLQSQ